MSPAAPHILSDVSYVRRINHESFFMLGAIFGEVGGWCLLLRAM